MFRTYVNCTRVKGNLEITGIENPMKDVSFLKVTEYKKGKFCGKLTKRLFLPRCVFRKSLNAFYHFVKVGRSFA